jgi:hypothetical protein
MKTVSCLRVAFFAACGLAWLITMDGCTFDASELRWPTDGGADGATCDVRCQVEGLRPDASLDLGSDQARYFGSDSPQAKNDTPSASEDGLSETGGDLLDAAFDVQVVMDVPPPLPDAPQVPVDSAAGNPLGKACTSNDQCLSGYCTDGVCCQDSCASVCMVCDLPNALGQCSMVPAGQDPRGSCPQDPAATCGRDGTCDGAAVCRRWIAGTVCASASCTMAPAGPGAGPLDTHGTALGARTCDGAGTCFPAATTSCSPYACSGSACASRCTGNNDCEYIAWCNGTKCQGRVGNGGPCTSDQECMVGSSCRMSVMMCAEN